MALTPIGGMKRGRTLSKINKEQIDTASTLLEMCVPITRLLADSGIAVQHYMEEDEFIYIRAIVVLFGTGKFKVAITFSKLHHQIVGFSFNLDRGTSGFMKKNSDGVYQWIEAFDGSTINNVSQNIKVE